MELLYLIVALTDGPFRFLIGILPPLMLALASFAFAAGWAFRRPGTSSRLLPWTLLACALALAFAMLMGVARPVRSIQQNMVQYELGHIGKDEAHAATDRAYSTRGIALRGLLHFGPLAACLAGALGLLAGERLHQLRSSRARTP